MKSPARHLRWAVAVLLASGLAAGCAGPQTDNSGGSGGGAVNIVLYQKPTLFSPIEPAQGANQQVMSLIYQSLMVADPNLKLVPQLAESVDVSPDATTFTFHLTKGLKWSDGEPFTSADVLFTHQLLANPKTTSASVGSYADVKGAKEVTDGKAETLSGLTAPDDSTFVVTTTKANYGIIAQIGVYPIIPKHILGDKPLDQVAKDPFFTKPTVGLGPFQFVTYKTDQYVELKANPNFPTKPGVDKVYLKPLTADVATAQLGTGELDIAPIAPTDKDALDAAKLDFKPSPDGGFVRIGVNHTQARFKDKRIRQALLYGIDRKSIIDSALPGVGKPRNSAFDPSVSGKDIEQYAYNPDKAKQLLSAAGWDPNQTVRLSWIPGSNPDRDAAAIAVESQLKEIGVKIELKQIDPSAVTDVLDKMDFDLYLFGGGNYAVDSWNVNAIEGCDTFYPNGGNIVKFCDQGLDAKLKQANGTADASARMALYKDAAKIDNDLVPYLWLYTPGGLWAVNKRLQNFQPLNPTGSGFWQPEKWSIAAG
ncbi:ABC transporter substrate-binding protein [Actinophytocola sp.]|jgi:peptide/nickel transport system substrate-binding protein|uniref:ABC transporter substrate-binding protein n=1 Tax=Actinophytocola sp. TaxID=1872138 RepID=UPI002EDAA0F0